MITNNRIKSDTQSLELCGLSSDPKPTTYNGHDVGPNSIFKELDTGNVFYYTGTEWAVMKTSGDGSSGAGLPAVTSEDNGKVLGVVNGTWDKTEAPSGVEKFTVTGDLEENAGSGFTVSNVSASVADILTAINSGRNVNLILTAGVGVLTTIDLPLTQIIDDDAVVFGGTISGDDTIPGSVLVMLTSAGEAAVNLQVVNAPELPEVTSAENGDILTVVNGAWINRAPAIVPSPDNDYKVSISTDGVTINVDKSIADIVTAANTDKHVFAKVSVMIGGITVYQRFELTAWGAGAGNYIVTFGAVQEDDGASNPVCIKGENTGGTDNWVVC